MLLRRSLVSGMTCKFCSKLLLRQQDMSLVIDMRFFIPCFQHYEILQLKCKFKIRLLILNPWPWWKENNFDKIRKQYEHVVLCSVSNPELYLNNLKSMIAQTL